MQREAAPIVYEIMIVEINVRLHMRDKVAQKFDIRMKKGEKEKEPISVSVLSASRKSTVD